MSLGFGSIQFDAGAQWTLQGNTYGFGGTITGFAIGDTIDLAGVLATGSAYAGGILTLSEASGAATLDLPGSFTTQSFEIAADGSGGTDVWLACFREGTLIATPEGERPVEAIAAGDLVLAHDAGGGALAPRPVIWAGYRRVDAKRHPNPVKIYPVRVAAHAFGPGLPARDLFLSPDHALLLDGALIPVKLLINGGSIARVPVASVTYYHLELAEHAVLLAEGIEAESYLPGADRGNFSNGGGAVTLFAYFSAHAWEAHGCAPMVLTGPVLAAARRRLAG